jgi:ATP-dependent DNA helicase RecG
MRLAKILTEGESELVEFKESFHSNQEISKQICAFANTEGGSIFIGIADNGEIKGISGNLDELHQRISHANQSIQSMPIINSKNHNQDNKTIVEIMIQKSGEGHAHTFEGRVYVRIGTTVRKLEGQTLLDFMKHKHILCFDELKSNYDISKTDTNKIKHYLILRNNPEYLLKHSLDEFLHSTQLIRGERFLKNVAALFFVANTKETYSQNEIRIVKFAGIEAVDIIDQIDLREDIIANIENALKFIRRNLVVKYVISGKTPKREEITEYPLEVIREALINAVVHRDYFNPNSIQINLFSDRLEISSPGGLPEGLTKELFGRRSVRRNPITYRLLRDIGFVEGLGTGIPRMINSMRKFGLQDPQFNINNYFFEVVFYNAKGKLKPKEQFEDLNQRQISAINFLKKNKSIKTEVYAKINNVSPPTAIKDMDELIQLGFLKKIGKFRGVYYILDEDTNK